MLILNHLILTQIHLLQNLYVSWNISIRTGALKTHFRIGRHENKEERLFYFGLRILMQIQIQLLAIDKR
jgi:hypothetical protein